MALGHGSTPLNQAQKYHFWEYQKSLRFAQTEP
jgi:hypothetical protein